jgi:hypothetical protein
MVTLFPVLPYLLNTKFCGLEAGPKAVETLHDFPQHLFENLR